MRQHRVVWLSIGLIILSTVAVIILAGSTLVKAAPQILGKAPVWLQAESVQLSSKSGSSIHGWYHAPDRPKASIVLLHPLRGNRQSMLGRARFLAEAGLAVLLIDFQAHGESEGEKITFGHLESSDASAAVDYVRSRHAELPIIVRIAIILLLLERLLTWHGTQHQNSGMRPD